MPNVRGGAGTGFGGSASAGRNSDSSTRGARSGDSRGSKAGPDLTRDQITRMVTGKMLPSTQDNSPAPSIRRGGLSGPRPGTRDRWGLTIGQDPAIQSAQDAYNKAADSIQNRSFGQWLGDKALGFIPGFHTITPDWQHPETYAGGTYHTGWSPLAAAAGVAASAAPVPLSGTLASQAALAVNDAIKGPDYNFGSGTWHNSEQSPISQAFGISTNSPSPSSPTPSQGNGNPTNGGGNGALLPPVMGSPQAVSQPSGAALPPVTPPAPPGFQQNTQPGGWKPVPGPAPYGYLLPSYWY